MEQLNEKQRKICHTFYLDCKSKGIDPLQDEAGKQRALLLAQGNPELFRLFDGEADGWQAEAYKIGRDCETEKNHAEQQAARFAKIAEQRTLDEQAAALERTISKLRGRDKRSFFLQKRLDEASKTLKDAQKAMDNFTHRYEQMEKGGGDSWGTLGGIAAGVTGSTAVGAAVAANAMGRDAVNRSLNETLRKNMLMGEFPLLKSHVDNAQKEVNDAQAELEKVKLHLLEERPIEELMDSLTFGKPSIAFTEGNTMVVRVEAKTETAYQVAGVDAVLDGCLVAEVYEGETIVGEAFLNLPRDGFDAKNIVLKGHCLTAKPGGNYTVLILPVALWLIETYACQKEVPTLDDLIPTPEEALSWKPVPTHPTDWRKGLEERRREAERRAAEEKAAAAAQAKKTKRIAMITAPIVVVAIVAAVLISNFMKAQQEEAARLEAYNAAVALAEEGQYDEAIAAFTELGSYKDSAEQITNIQNQQLEEQYQAAVSILEDGEYEEARDRFNQLEGYRDSADIVQQISNEIDVYNDAIRAFEAGDFETAKATIESNKYVTLDPPIISCIDFVTPYIGNWTFLSGDAQLIPTVIHWNGECHSLETAFSGSRSSFGVEGTIVLSCNISDSGTTTVHLEFEVDFREKSIEVSFGNNRRCIELTPQDTLLITVERDDGFTSTAEYQRVS